MTGKTPPRLEGRTGEVWKLYVSGWTQESIAQHFGIHQTRVSQIIAGVRALLPEKDRAQIIQEEVEFLGVLRREAMALATSPLPPAFDQKGFPLSDPVTKEVIRDASGRVAAMKLALDVQAQHRKLLGLDQPLKVDATVSHAAAEKAAEMAAAAVARMAEEEG